MAQSEIFWSDIIDMSDRPTDFAFFGESLVVRLLVGFVNDGRRRIGHTVYYIRIIAYASCPSSLTQYPFLTNLVLERL